MLPHPRRGPTPGDCSPAVVSPGVLPKPSNGAMTGATRPDEFPEPEVDPTTGRLVYRMGKLDQFALLPEIPPGATVTLRVLQSSRVTALGRTIEGP